MGRVLKIEQPGYKAVDGELCSVSMRSFVRCTRESGLSSATMGSRYYIEDWGTSSIQYSFDDDEEVANGEVKIIEIEPLEPVSKPTSLLEKVFEEYEKPETRKVCRPLFLPVAFSVYE